MKSVSLRPWSIKDAEFVVQLRNKPELMRWFRQDRALTVAEQIHFMKTRPHYEAYIVEYEGKPIGVIAQEYYELSIVAPFEYHVDAIRLLEQVNKPRMLYGEVFVQNPMLGTYLTDCGFKAVHVKERRYYKRECGAQDVVFIEKYCEA